MYLPPIGDPNQIAKDGSLMAIKPWWVIFLGAFILYVVPASDVFEMPWLGDVINGLASLVPSIARWVELSPFPEHTKLFSVLIVVMIPVQVFWLLSYKQLWKDFSVDTKKKPVPVLVKLWLCFLIAVMVAAFVVLPFNYAIVDTPPCRVCVNTVKWAQLFLGCIYSLAVSGLIGYSILILRVLITSHRMQGK